MKTVVYVGTSLDGFIARKDGDVKWIAAFADEEVSKAFEEFIAGIDVLLMGRKTFEKVLEHEQWPYKLPVFVLSTTLKSVPADLKGKIEIVSMQPRQILAHLSERGYSNIYVDGANVIQSFLREDLIDELILSPAPVLLGEGISLFGTLDKDLAFKYIRTAFFSNGLMSNYYERDRKKRL